jgi:hypothetical protein
MTKELPPLIDRFVAAVNRGNTEAFLACFPADGVVDDWGRRFTGHEAIRGWCAASEVRDTPQRTLATNFGSKGAPASL